MDNVENIEEGRTRMNMVEEVERGRRGLNMSGQD